MKRQALIPHAAAAAVTLLCLSAAAQQPAKTEPAKLEAWPTLREADREKVLPLLDMVRKVGTPQHESAQKQLIAMGDAAVPLMLQQINDKNDNSNAPYFALLDQVLGKQHAALMAREVKKQKVELRRYLMQRLCRFGDPSLKEVFASGRKEKDALTAFYAELGLLGLQQRDALEPVLAYTKSRWSEVAGIVAESLAGARSQECGNWVFEAIAKAPAVDQMAGLRLLRHLMVKEQAIVLRTYLESADHSVKREAINTARVLHGEPPIENLSVFQAIEQAKQWLKKL